MAGVISLLDSDDDAVVVPIQPARASKPATSARRTLPDLSDDDDDDQFLAPSLLGFTAAGPASTAAAASSTSRRAGAGPSASSALGASPSAGASRASSPTRMLVDTDDDEIVAYDSPPPSTATGAAQRVPRRPPPPARTYVDIDDDIIEVVSSTLPVPPPPAPKRTPSTNLPAFPFDLSRSLASQVNALASGSGTSNPARPSSRTRPSPAPRSASPPAPPAPPPPPRAASNHRADSGVAGLGRPLSRSRTPFTASDLEDDDAGGPSVAASRSGGGGGGLFFSDTSDASADEDGEDLARLVAEIERVTAAHASALASASTAGVDDGAADAVSPPKAKRKKYKLDSSDGEVENGASAAAVKGKGKARAASGAGEARRVKGKGKERSATADGGESDGGPAPAKRKRKTAEEIAFEAAAKARARQDKAEETARRKAEKEIYKEANKLRSRASAMHELLLELPKQAADSRSIVARIRPELVDRLDESGVRLTEYSPPSADDGADPPANVIRFKRELKAEYDERTREFTAIPARIHPESTAVVLLSADGAARHVRARTWLSLPGRVRRCAGLNPKGQVVMLIHGLAKLYKQEKSAADKAYDARVRALSGAPAPAPARRAGARDEQAFVSKDDMERAIVQLQVIDRSFITRVETDKELVDYLMSFAGDVAHRPYKLIEYSHLPFCPDSAVAKGANPSDTLCKMLATVKGVTPAMTLAVLKAFGTFRGLMDAYDRARDDTAADMLLANLIAEHKVDGTPNARYINKAKSAQIRRMLRVEDPRALWN